MTRFRHALAVLVQLVGFASAAYGQGGQYTAPGALGIAPENERERLQTAVDEARWKFGVLRVDPWVSLRDVRLEQREGEPTEVTAGIGAGLRSYIPFGSKLVVAAHVMPEYIWHSESDAESRVAGRYGLGLFYYANRLGFELTATTSDQDAFATSEVNRRAQIDNVTYRTRVEVPISRRLGVYVNASRLDQLVADPAPGAVDLGDLSEQTDSFEAGLGFQVAKTVRLSLGAGTRDTEFDESARDLSSEGEFLSVAIDWNRPKTGASVAFRKNDLRPKPGSSFEPFDSTTWRGQLRWSPNAGLALALYGQRSLSYSVLVGEDTFLDHRLGLRVSFPVGRRLNPSLYYEIGTNDYVESGRVDDTTSWGGAISFSFGKWFRVNLSGRSTRIEDQAGGTDSYTEIGGGISFSIGSDRSVWY